MCKIKSILILTHSHYTYFHTKVCALTNAWINRLNFAFEMNAESQQMNSWD